MNAASACNGKLRRNFRELLDGKSSVCFIEAQAARLCPTVRGLLENIHHREREVEGDIIFEPPDIIVQGFVWA